MNELPKESAPASETDAMKKTISYQCAASQPDKPLASSEAPASCQPLSPEEKPATTGPASNREVFSTQQIFNESTGKFEPGEITSVNPERTPRKSTGYTTWFDWRRKVVQIFKDDDQEPFKEIDMHPLDDGEKLNVFLDRYRKAEPWCDKETLCEIVEEIENALGTLGIQCDVFAEKAFPTVPLPWFVHDAMPIGELEAPSADDGTELIKDRFLCRGGGLLLVGSTGVGKSSLAMQMAIYFSLGNPVFGITPAGALRSLIVQAENDNGDMHEMFNGVCRGVGLNEDDADMAGRMIRTIQVDSKRGQSFFLDALEPLLAQWKPDVVWIDPALAYIDGDSNSQKDVGNWLRAGLNPLLHKHSCAAVVVHHTAKPARGNNNAPLAGSDRAYMGSGSAEFPNWARAIISINSIGSSSEFELVAAKRGTRLGWKLADGIAPCYSKIITHSKQEGVICWGEYDGPNLIPDKIKSKTVADIMEHVPQNEPIEKKALMSKCRGAKISKHAAEGLIAEAIHNKQLFEWQIKRSGVRPQILVARQAQPEQTELPK